MLAAMLAPMLAPMFKSMPSTSTSHHPSAQTAGRVTPPHTTHCVPAQEPARSGWCDKLRCCDVAVLHSPAPSQNVTHTGHTHTPRPCPTSSGAALSKSSTSPGCHTGVGWGASVGGACVRWVHRNAKRGLHLLRTHHILLDTSVRCAAANCHTHTASSIPEAAWVGGRQGEDLQCRPLAGTAHIATHNTHHSTTHTATHNTHHSTPPHNTTVRRRSNWGWGGSIRVMHVL